MTSPLFRCSQLLLTRPPLLVLLPLGLLQSAAADVDLRKGSVAHFASASEGAEILTRRDDFVERLSEFDRAARMKTDKSVSEEEFLRFVKANVSTWTGGEKAKIEAAIVQIRPALEALPVALPKSVFLVKTTGAEEGKAFYTRDTAIVLPESELGRATAQRLEKTIAHELFHILSRQNPVMREALYNLIGFTKCPEVEFPAELRRRRITNPDAPRNDHFIRIELNGKPVVAVPILFSQSDNYDVSRGGEFFSYLQFNFLIVRKEGGASASDERVPLEKISGFFEQVGRNTHYVIHPEEILAENFALILLNEQNVASPEILQRMRAILFQH
jgi:hypothetical protein